MTGIGNFLLIWLFYTKYVETRVSNYQNTYKTKSKNPNVQNQLR